MSSEHLASLFVHSELDRALDENPFTPIMEKYVRLSNKFTPEQLDELQADLETSDFMRTLEADLAQAPHFTSLYRYDPYSFPDGAQKYWLRVFEDLTVDKVHITRTDQEVAIIIDHPSVLSSSRIPEQAVAETVVWTSVMLERKKTVSVEESTVPGFQIKHGDSIENVT